MLLLSSGADDRGMIDRARYVRTKFSKSFRSACGDDGLAKDGHPLNCLSPYKQRVSKDRCVVTARREKHEAMPDRFLKTQAPPEMKDDTHRIQHTACREKPES